MTRAPLGFFRKEVIFMQQDAVQRFASQVLSDLASAYGGVMVNIGHRLGLYRALAGAGPVTPDELAVRTGTHTRYVREWLCSQAAGGYVEAHAGGERFELPAEHVPLLADTDSPLFMAPAFAAAASMFLDEDKTVALFRSGAGMPWGAHDHRLFEAVEAFYRTGYKANLTSVWIPKLARADEKLRAGGRVADVGCGHGASTILMAQAYPASEIVGFDCHIASIETAKARASEAGLGERVRFEVADARSFGGGPYDLICFLDSYHDLGDPHLAAAHARSLLSQEGSLMLVEPFASANIHENVGPVARLYFSASTTMCTPNALSQGSLALGAQAGPERLSATLREAGFRHVRSVHETPFNMVLEARD
jgi:2-polyprenyl-3-methyl-5-hydroxy-6-metoxy-1,4-benzoquinol methylase